MTDNKDKPCTCDACTMKTAILLGHEKFDAVRTLLTELADELEVHLRVHLVADHKEPGAHKEAEEARA